MTAAIPTYRVTFGNHRQTAWTDVRTLTWPELATILTDHKTGPKQGTAIVPAVFRGQKRHKAEATEIGIAMLDADAGHQLAEIEAALEARGWAAVIHSTHSHGTTRTDIAKSVWEQLVAENPDTAAQRALEAKGYLPHVTAGARRTGVNGDTVTIEHAPCPKFRVAIPLTKPWCETNYPNQDAANEVWRERIDAVAAALGLHHDQSCTDTSRLFFLPRHAKGAAYEARVIEGAACDIWALPAAPKARAAETVPLFQTPIQGTAEFVDSKTGEVLNLERWAAQHGKRFEVAAALHARAGHALTGVVADGVKVHIRCPREECHSRPGADDATFVTDASRSKNGGFVIHCRHTHCEHIDRLAFLAAMLQKGWLSVADLTNAGFLAAEQPNAGPGSDAAWPEPADLLGHAVEAAAPFPVSFLPPAFRALAVDAADRMQAPPDYIAIALIIAAATLIGKDFRMRPKAADGWHERPCLWGGIIGEPGSLKSPAFNAALGPLQRLQSEAQQEHASAMEAYAAALAAGEQAERAWKKDCDRAETAGTQKPERPEMAHKPAAPTMRRIMTGDVTQEKLVELMAENPRGLLLYRDELSSWFMTFDQYRPGADRKFFLECHAGQPYTNDRKGSGTTIIPETFLNIVGGFQPDVVAKVLGGGDLDGMAARFSLLVWPDPVADWRYVDRTPDYDAEARVHATMARLAELQPINIFDFAPDPAFRFDAEGQAVFTEWYTRLMRRGAAGMDSAFQAHLRKYPGLFARLCVVHHLVAHVEEPKADATRVGAATAVAVRDFIDLYLEPHAKRIYKHLGQDGARASAIRIAEWLKKERIQDFTARDVRQKEWSKLTDPKVVDRVLDYLENVAGWIRSSEAGPGPKGGRPTTRYSVNPKIWR